MKIKSILLAATAVVTSVATSGAADIKITGATAFRASAVSAIARAFGVLPNNASNCTVAYTGSNFGNANQHIFTGTFPGISGTTTIRTSWSGSTEGIRAIANFNNTAGNASYIPTSVTGTALTIVGNSITGGTSNYNSGFVTENQAKIAFSDVETLVTPQSNLTFTGGKVGVLTFVPMLARGSSANITNINDNQLRALQADGFLNLGNITGLQADADSGNSLYWTGRNDGSGTRSVYLLENHSGDQGPTSNDRLIEQYRLTVGSNLITSLRRWPTADGNNASTLFNTDQPGNGGYSSGSTLRTQFQQNALNGNVEIRDEANNLILNENASLITVLATEDAAAAIGNTTGPTNGLGNGTTQPRVIAWNGVSITPVTAGGGGLSVADKAKVANGAYTFWSFENMYGYLVSAGTTGATGPELTTFFDNIFAAVQLPINIGGNGLTLGEMSVDRGADGATITDL